MGMGEVIFLKEIDIRSSNREMKNKKGYKTSVWSYTFLILSMVICFEFK
jgi:hypothetical protein